jgi:hypothetical protein
MSGPLERLLQGPSLESTAYPPESRYHGLAHATLTLADGRTVRYLRRRQFPDPATMAVIAEYRVVEGDRLDNLAMRFLGDSLAAWRIADANGALRMEAMVEEIGLRVRISMPAGMPGAAHA